MNEAPSGAETCWIRLAPLDRLPPRQAVRVDVDDLPIALFHTEDGLRAVDGLCPHAGRPLSEGDFDAATVTCSWHRWRYDLRTGERLDRKGYPVHVYSTRVVDGWIWLAAPPRD